MNLAVSLLGIVAGHLLGCLMRSFGAWLGRKTDKPPSRIWSDLKALVVLGAIILVGVPELLDADVSLPPEAHKVALGLLLFYFGPRLLWPSLTEIIHGRPRYSHQVCKGRGNG